MTTEILKWRTRGQFLIAERTAAGVPKGFNDAGCADLGTASVNLSIDQGSHVESCSGQDLEDFTYTKSKKGEFAIGLTEFTTANLLMALNGTKVDAAISPTVVSGEVGPTDLEAGQYVQLGGATPHQTITGLVVNDASVSPAVPLVLATDYELDAVTGLIKMLNDQDGPLTFDYSHTDLQMIAMLSAGTLERWVKFNGFNTAQNDRLEIVDLYRVNFPPTNAFALLPDDLGVLTLTGKILADSTKPNNGPLGRFGCIHSGPAT
jgi:hypothetical protein